MGISPYLFLGAWHQFWLFLTKILTDLANFDQPRPVLKKIKTKLFKLRKVNHTLGDHRSGRAWDSNHGPNETDGRHLSKKPKNLRKKLPKKKNEKFSEKKIKQKKLKKHLV